MGHSQLSLLSSALLVLGARSALPRHIVLVLSDDLGWHAPSYMNAELQTPTLASLAANGTVLSSFYTYMFCSPSRASFLTGRYPYKTEWVVVRRSVYRERCKVVVSRRFADPRETTSYLSAKKTGSISTSQCCQKNWRKPTIHRAWVAVCVALYFTARAMAPFSTRQI